MKEAIKLAIEKGGYNWGGWKEVSTLDHSETFDGETWYYIGGSQVLEQQIVLDPNFWKCLGEILSWNDFIPECAEPNKIVEPNQWINEAMNYYFLLLTDGDTEQFFEDLLKTPR